MKLVELSASRFMSKEKSGGGLDSRTIQEV